MTPFSHQEFARKRRAREPLLDEIIAAIDTTPVHERQIRDEALLIFGRHDPTDGSVELNTGLARVLIFLHEFCHVVRPRWSERTVRARSVRLLHSLSDDDIAAIDRQLVAAIRRSRATASTRDGRRRAPRGSRASARRTPA